MSQRRAYTGFASYTKYTMVSGAPHFLGRPAHAQAVCTRPSPLLCRAWERGCVCVRVCMCLISFRIHDLYKQPQFYSVSKSCTGTTLKGRSWIHGICIMLVIYSLIRCPNVSQFMNSVQSPDFTPTHALLDLLLELLSISWSCMPN